jgi:glycosyltransferase involved in cell wall biosynthesis
LLYYFSKENFPMPITNIFSQEIDEFFEKKDFDLVHAHHPFWMGNKARKLGKKYDLPVVFTYHTRLEKYAHYIPGFWFIRKLFINRFSHWMIKRFSNKCQAVFAPTETARHYLRNIGVRTPVEVLSTGVDFDDYDFSEEELDKFKSQYVAEDEKLLISVSRLSREKNLYFLLDGLREIKKQAERSFKCLLVGEGPEEDNIKQYISEHELEENVELVGGVDHRKIGKFYCAADVFAFASTTETQGMVLLEAMAGRTPVVAVKSSGVDDVVENGYNGFKTAEDARAWSQEVVRLLENQQLLQKTAGNAYELARKYSVKKMAARAEKIYYRTRENMEVEN